VSTSDEPSNPQTTLTPLSGDFH